MAALRQPLPDWADAQAACDGVRQKKISEANMAEFDLCPPAIRRIEHVTGNLGVAVRLYASGYTTPSAAEVAVRRLLEAQSVRSRR